MLGTQTIAPTDACVPEGRGDVVPVDSSSGPIGCIESVEQGNEFRQIDTKDAVRTDDVAGLLPSSPLVNEGAYE